jgi:hypothetical protein
MPKRAGRPSVAQTPAPKSDKIYGSKKNPKGSATEKKSKSIKLSDKTIDTLKDKLDSFKKSHPAKKNIDLNDLKAVYRRGSGAYSSSHRPTITGGAPNSRAAWSYARVNKFLKKAGGAKVKAAYVQDDDLMANGGVTKRGDCYEAAAQFCMGSVYMAEPVEFVGEPYLVHAEVKGQGKAEGIRFGHAWIEDDENVYDYSNGRKIVMPKIVYYAIGDIHTENSEKYQRYTFPEARAKMLKTKHYGSWDIDTEYADGGETQGYRVYVNDEYRRTIKDEDLKQYYLEKGFQMNDGKLQIYGNDISFEDGGDTSQHITCINCGWEWETADSAESDKYVCHQCGFDNSLFYDGGILKPTMPLDQIAEKHNVSFEYIEMQLDKGMQHEKEHTDSDEVATSIALHHLAERPDYYEELEKMKLEYGGNVILEDNSPEEYEIEDFLKQQKAESHMVMTCDDSKIYKAMICKTKCEIADKRMSETENPEELNAWNSYKNIWNECLESVLNDDLDKYKVGGKTCGCGCGSIYSKGGMFSKGGLAYGNSHDKGGMPMKVKSTGQNIEIEGGEGVVNKRSMQSAKKVEFQGQKMTPCEAVSKINQMGGGVKFKCEEVADIIAEDGNF